MNSYKKRCVIVSGPVCSGKTTLALNIAHNRKNCFYVDKDDLVPTSNSAFDAVLHLFKENADIPMPYDTKTLELHDRHSAFFKDFLRDPEYDSVRDILLKGIQFNDFVIVNAPYKTELRQEASGSCPAFDELRRFFDKEECEFFVVFVHISKDELKRRLIHRKENDPSASARDTNVYNDLDGYIERQILDAPDLTRGKNVDRLFVFEADTDELRDRSYALLMNELGIENYEPYNRNIHVNRITN